MPQTKNITSEFSVALAGGEKVFTTAPAALEHLRHHESEDRKRAGRRTQFMTDTRELREKIDESVLAEDSKYRSYQESGEPTDEKRKRIDWRAPYREERTAWKAAIQANEVAGKKVGGNVADTLKKFVSTTRVPWREVEMPTIRDARNPIDIIRERVAELVAVEREERETQNANRTDREVENIIRSEYERRMLLGAPNFGDVMRGGSFRFNGAFSPSNPGARMQLPMAAATIHGDASTVFVSVEDAMNFAIWADDDEKILTKLLKAAREANAGKLQISEPDKVRRLAEIAVRKLAAQRHLEASFRLAESQGVEIKRRELPPEVLLWLERDTTARTAPKKVRKIEPDFEDDTDEGRDE